jgi:hypothetical protein
VITVIVLVDLKPESKLWGFLRFPLGRFPLRNVRGLRFSKILGSGENGGFGLKPSSTHQGVFCVFDAEEHADAFLKSGIVKGYRDRAREFFTAKLQAYSAKGSWSGSTIAVDATEPQSGPIAALTRASIKPFKAAQFWKRSPPAEESLAKAKGCLLAVGLGEAPIFRQATFSIWENLDAMNAYARTGAHMEAIKASLSGEHFSESMFVRFKPIAPTGVWKGRQFV